MQTVIAKQTLAFENKTVRKGESINVQNSVAKELHKNGLVDLGDETEDEPAEESKNSVTFSDDKGKKIYDSGNTGKHLEDDKKKPSAVKEVAKNKDPKEK